MFFIILKINQENDHTSIYGNITIQNINVVSISHVKFHDLITSWYIRIDTIKALIIVTIKTTVLFQNINNNLYHFQSGI